MGFFRGFHKEEMEGIGDIGGLREVDGESRQQFWMKYRGLNRVPSQRGVIDLLRQLLQIQ